jgi:hypothetical protein
MMQLPSTYLSMPLNIRHANVSASYTTLCTVFPCLPLGVESLCFLASCMSSHLCLHGISISQQSTYLHYWPYVSYVGPTLLTVVLSNRICSKVGLRSKFSFMPSQKRESDLFLTSAPEQPNARYHYTAAFG